MNSGMKKDGNTVDVIMDILKETLSAEPSSTFVESLLKQYQQRGSLSKKQLEGLHNKASRIVTITNGRLATLQAIILKKPTRERSAVTKILPTVEVDDVSGEIISSILEKYPQHKRILYFQLKLENKEMLSAADKTELKKFKDILL